MGHIASIGDWAKGKALQIIPEPTGVWWAGAGGQDPLTMSLDEGV